MIPQGIICDKCGELANLKCHDIGTSISKYWCKCGNEQYQDQSMICKNCKKPGEMPYWLKDGDEVDWFCSLECMDYYRINVDGKRRG